MPIDPNAKLTDPAEVLFRQANPSMVVDGIPSSAVFGPNSGDRGQFSVDRGALISPKDAYLAFLAKSRLSSGTWGLTVDEFSHCSLTAYGDPLADSPSHALVDYAALGTSALEKVKKKLKAKALARGRLHP